MQWLNNTTIEMDGYRIILDYAHGGSPLRADGKTFPMMKARDFLAQYDMHVGEEFKRILELGIYQGGSFVYLDKLYRPEKISAIELSDVKIAALDQYAADSAGRAKVHYRTSQDDVEKLTRIIAEDFGGELDFVVDDASHFYEPTRTAFKTVFPYIRPGGLYIIEDWSWSFQKDYQHPDHIWSGMNSLANLTLDIMEDMALGTMVAEVTIVECMMKIRRSNAPIGGSVLEHEGRRGRPYGLL